MERIPLDQIATARADANLKRIIDIDSIIDRVIEALEGEGL